MRGFVLGSRETPSVLHLLAFRGEGKSDTKEVMSESQQKSRGVKIKRKPHINQRNVSVQVESRCAWNWQWDLCCSLWEKPSSWLYSAYRRNAFWILPNRFHLCSLLQIHGQKLTRVWLRLGFRSSVFMWSVFENLPKRHNSGSTLFCVVFSPFCQFNANLNMIKTSFQLL